MKGSRRGFVATTVGGGLAGVAASASAEAKTGEKQVDRRKFGRIGKEVSIYGLGLGSAFSNRWARIRKVPLRCSNARSISASTIGIPPPATGTARS